jgi:hypothetical protein
MADVIIAIMTNLAFGIGRGTPAFGKSISNHGFADVMAITKWSIDEAAVVRDAPGRA